MIEQPPEQLQRHILNAMVWPVKQLQNSDITTSLMGQGMQRYDIRVSEHVRSVSLFKNFPVLHPSDGALDERKVTASAIST